MRFYLVFHPLSPLFIRIWKVVHPFVEIKIFCYHIYYENIGQKHNKILKSQEIGQEQTEVNNMLVK